MEISMTKQKKSTPPTVFIVAARSGGHLLPAIKIAQKEFRSEKQTRFVLLTTTRKLEQAIAADHSFISRVVSLPLPPVPGRRWWRYPLFAAQLSWTFLKSLYLLIRLRPHTIISCGGYLSTVVALASAFLDKPVAFDTVILGEVGLSSEVRSVSQITVRINEAEKLGFQKCIVPKNNLKSGQDLKNKNIELWGVETVKEALDKLT